ncbi:HlyD family secretion protein [Zhongshania aliphaticivorans]|uniref:HlyD family secretion protein n=1 Tax=Zhongshania aliphaticivorans TaxID=1470434 RepID=UPI0012E58577|nr:HlyD family secretion protein [Zhongshania aliphaticivorans]CAA0106738.1 Multidrug export protein EmrA [Zhongshania aliphaticivorans]
MKGQEEQLSAELDSDQTAARRRLRTRLFMVVPVVGLFIAVYLFMFGGRYITTDNAYIKADVVNVGSEISGNIASVRVKENQYVEAGDILLTIDARAFEVELHDAQAELEQAFMRIDSLKAAYIQKQAALAAAKDDFEFASKQQQRINDLHKRGMASGTSLDQAQRDLNVARNTVSKLMSDSAETLAQLGGKYELDIAHHPAVMAAQAELERAELNVERCVLRAPIAGVASKVPQRGQYAMPGLPLISVVANSDPWIVVNFKEDQLAKLALGAEVAVEIDAYPGELWTATVDSIAQATGAEFALLPPQNATGNWVKIVQRLPVRLAIDHHENESPLRAGLSASVEVDTGVPERMKAILAFFGGNSDKLSTANNSRDSALIAGQL